MPELIAAAKTAPTQPTQQQPVQGQPVRTTVQPSTASPATQTARPNLKTIEGIKATIADLESKGVSLNW